MLTITLHAIAINWPVINGSWVTHSQVNNLHAGIKTPLGLQQNLTSIGIFQFSIFRPNMNISYTLSLKVLVFVVFIMFSFFLMLVNVNIISHSCLTKDETMS